MGGNSSSPAKGELPGIPGPGESDGIEKRILVCGMPNSGKTQVVESIAKYSHKVARDLYRRVPFFVNFKRFVIYDFCADEEARDQWSWFLKKPHKRTARICGLVLVVDSCDASAICRKLPDQPRKLKVTKKKEVLGAHIVDSRSILEIFLRSPALNGVPILILANKQDLEGAVSPAEVAMMLGVTHDTMKKFGRRGVRVMGCSAVSLQEMKSAVTQEPGITMLPDESDDDDDGAVESEAWGGDTKDEGEDEKKDEEKDEGNDGNNGQAPQRERHTDNEVSKSEGDAGAKNETEAEAQPQQPPEYHHQQRMQDMMQAESQEPVQRNLPLPNPDFEPDKPLLAAFKWLLGPHIDDEPLQYY